eukprot:TRINITY_DN24063_c0_g1_i1.p1 TRINITY_DN24063_c0_g1~~TRINITY_DN24063_c0_g1_i1.p1  ORF type:complete len:286 (+),score=25.69 TRINITY_DN24063_c0_g1_i1:509-1366(+)
MSPFRFLNYAMNHPLGKRAPVRTFSNIIAWQIKSALNPGFHELDWIAGSKLRAKKGLTGATGNIYYGLHEFYDMGFVIHFLRPEDLFVDVGANIGSYTILASAVCKADTVCFEPDATTAGILNDNIKANGIEAKARVIQMAVGSKVGETEFTIGLDTANHVAENIQNGAFQTVAVTTLDTELANKKPTMMKIDVEGFEAAVIEGAMESLANRSLMAIELETIDQQIILTLAKHGFHQYQYNPFSRQLSQSAVPGHANNQLFLRDVETVRQRMNSAEHRQILGQQI